MGVNGEPGKGPIPGVVLAAGASRRLGQPKQLLPYRGGTLLSHAVERVHGAFDPVVVVIGAEAERMRAALAAGPAVEIVENTDWQEGMASSIRAGARHLGATAPEAVLLTLVDQPLVTKAHLLEMRETFFTSRPEVVAAVYGGIVGVPAIFAASMLERLAALRGVRGARSVVGGPSVRLVRFLLDEADFDIDTPEDAARLG